MNVEVMQCQRRIILLGKTGNGKSSTGNSILQSEAFEQRVSPNSVTETCLMKNGINPANTITYNVVDTPGLLDTEKNVSTIALEIQKSVDICPEPHAFLIVFSGSNRMTADERFTIDMLRIMFGECIFKHSIVVFTHGNNFESNAAFQQFWEQSTVLVNLIELCDNRVAKIENTKDFLIDNEGTQSIFKIIENMSNAGQIAYRYTGVNIHRSAIEEYSKKHDGNEDIQKMISELVIQIEEKVNKEKWKTLICGCLIGGTTVAVVIGAVWLAGPDNAVDGVAGTAGDAANTAAPSNIGTAVINNVAIGCEAVQKKAVDVAIKIKM